MTERPPHKSEASGSKDDSQFYRKVKSDYRWKVFGQAAFITLSSIFIFGGIGWLIDGWIGKERHTFFITLLILSYPVTQFALYRKMKNFKITKDK